MMECHEVPRLPRKTTWPQLLTRKKSHVFATFPIGTATLRPRRSQTDGCKRLRTVADGCGRLRTVADGCGRLRTPKAGSREHGSTPRSPNVKGEPFATHSGKNTPHIVLTYVIYLTLMWCRFMILVDQEGDSQFMGCDHARHLHMDTLRWSKTLMQTSPYEVCTL